MQTDLTFKQKAAQDIITTPRLKMDRIRKGAFNDCNIPLYIQMCVSLYYHSEYMIAVDKGKFLEELSK